MSALGQKRTLRLASPMSALPPKIRHGLASKWERRARVDLFLISAVPLHVRRTKSCFFETDSWFRVPRDGNGRGCWGAALLGKWLRQLGEIRRDPPRLVLSQLRLPERVSRPLCCPLWIKRKVSKLFGGESESRYSTATRLIAHASSRRPQAPAWARRDQLGPRNSGLDLCNGVWASFLFVALTPHVLRRHFLDPALIKGSLHATPSSLRFCRGMCRTSCPQFEGQLVGWYHQLILAKKLPSPLTARAR